MWAAPLTILGHGVAHRGPTSHGGDRGQPGDEGGHALLLSTLSEAQPPILSPAQAVCFSCGRRERGEETQRVCSRLARRVPISMGAGAHFLGGEEEVFGLSSSFGGAWENLQRPPLNSYLAEHQDSDSGG